MLLFSRLLALALIGSTLCLSTTALAQDETPATQRFGWGSDHPLLQLPADGELVVEKVRVAEARYVKGRLMTPVDGSVYSGRYDGKRQELSRNATHGTPTNYDFLPMPGYHVWLADDFGVNYLAIRGGFAGRILPLQPGDGQVPNADDELMRLESWLPDAPEDFTPTDRRRQLWSQGYGRWLLDQSLPAAMSFYFTDGPGSLADVGFFRVGDMARAETYGDTLSFSFGAVLDSPPAALLPYLEMSAKYPRFEADERRLVSPGEADVALEPGRFLHVLTEPLAPGTAVGAIRLDLDLRDVPAGNRLVVVVNDPLNRRRELMRVDLQQTEPGPVRVLLDIPDQLMPAESRLAYRLGKSDAGPTLVPASANAPFREHMAALVAAKDQLLTDRKAAANQMEREMVGETYQMAVSLRHDQMRQLIAEHADDPHGSLGRPIWVSVLSEHGGVLAAGSRLDVLTVDPDAAMAEWSESRYAELQALVGMYSESRPWNRIWFANSYEEFVHLPRGQRAPDLVMEVMELLYELVAWQPDDPLIQQYYGWLHANWQPELQADALPEMPAIDGVPRWAQLLERNRESYEAIVAWWLENRGAPNGEFGGSVNDDTCLVPWWTALALIDAGMAERVREAHQGVMRNALDHALDRGLNRQTTDYGHGYEYGINQTAYMPVLFYGDPEAVENAMQSAWAMEQATVLTPEGYRIFKPHDARKEFGSNLIEQPLPEDPDWWKTADKRSPSGVNLHPMIILAWYNRHPRALQILDEFYHFGGGYDSGSQFDYAMYWMTEDPKWLPESITDDNGRLRLRFWEGGGDLLRHGPYTDDPALAQFAKQQHAMERDPLAAWMVTGEETWLSTMLERTLWGERPKSGLGGMERYFHMYTAAEQHTDRLFLPIEPMSDAYLGGFMVRNKFWPAFAVSWEGFDDEFAALVREQSKTSLTLSAVNLSATPKSGAFRVWQLNHGRYRIRIGDQTEERELRRMDSVALTLPPQQELVVRIELIEALDPIFGRADLAVGAVASEDGALRVTIHNIGTAAVESATVEARDAAGTVLASASLSTLEAPLDFRPRRQSVTLQLPSGSPPVAVVTVRSDAAEITDMNNHKQLNK